MKEGGLHLQYERHHVPFVRPARKAKYIPDFAVVPPNHPSGHHPLFVEDKGIFDAQDRQKHLLIKEQHPEVEVRFVFYNAHATIGETKPTDVKPKVTYAQWCDKHGFKWAHRTIPQDWIDEFVALQKRLNIKPSGLTIGAHEERTSKRSIQA